MQESNERKTLPSNSADAREDAAWTNDLKRGRMPGPRLPGHKNVAPGLNDSTKCVHAGTFEDPSVGSVTTPIFQTSTFLFQEDTYRSFWDGSTRDVPIYTRYGNPNQWSVQQKMAFLEGAESSVVFSSGMSAIFTTLIALSNRGGHIISSRDVYGGTYNLLREDIHQLGRSVTFVESTDFEAIERAVRPETQILFFETLTNPLLKAIPLSKIVRLAKEKRLLVILDNTFMTPVLLKPIELGVDVVVHSATKYLNGHSDLIAGTASGSRKYMDRVWAQHLRVGGQLEPFSCFLLERGLKTLAVRMQRQEATARQIVRFLAVHPRVRKVYHPSAPDYPYQWVSEYCTRGHTPMISFEVTGGDDAALAFMGRLKIAVAATSLGGIESLVSLPFNTSHSTLTQAQRVAAGINPGLVRFSVGIEDPNDLIQDLEQALLG